MKSILAGDRLGGVLFDVQQEYGLTQQKYRANTEQLRSEIRMRFPDVKTDQEMRARMITVIVGLVVCCEQIDAQRESGDFSDV